MAELVLVDGIKILIDDEDLPRVQRYRWRVHPKLGCAFAQPRIGSKHPTVLLQRLLLSVSAHHKIIFKNRNKLDYRKSNLVSKDKRGRWFYEKSVPCACGCGTLMRPWKHGRHIMFVDGHVVRKYKSDEQRKQAHKKQSRDWWRRRVRVFKEKRRQLKRKAMAFLGNKCAFCGVKYDGKNGAIFEFHHLNPGNKEINMTRLLDSRKWSRLLKELRKCCLTCANCHNLRHGGEW
jgi:hypothetical protein